MIKTIFGMQPSPFQADLPDRGDPYEAGWFARHPVAGLVPLLAVFAAVYLPYFPSGLYMDDWSQMSNVAIHPPWQWLVMWDYSRPFMFTLDTIMQQTVGVDLVGSHTVNLAVVAVSAAAMYWVLIRLFPRRPWLAMLAACAWLTYPADDATRSLVCLLLAKFNFLLFLAGAGLALRYARRGGGAALFCGLAAMFIPLFVYEAHLGLMLAWGALLVLLRDRNAGGARLVGVVSPIMLGLLFVAWRVVGIKLTGVGASGGSIPIDPLLYIERVGQGYAVMVVAWGKCLAHGRELFGETAWSVLRLAIAASPTVLLIWALAPVRDCANVAWAPGEKRAEIGRIAWVILGGAFFLAAGLVPFIAEAGPSLIHIVSRTNFLAIPGAAVALTALVSLVVTAVSRSRQRVPFLVVLGMLPFLLLGGAAQLAVERDGERSWENQKRMWRTLIDMAPNVKSGTLFVFSLPRRPSLEYGHREVLYTDHGAAGATIMLYNDLKIRSSIIHQGEAASRKKFSPDVFHDVEWKNKPYSEIIFLRFDPDTQLLTLIDAPREYFSLEFDPKGYSPFSTIIPRSGKEETYRYLLQ